jgi:hypothetical protein
VIAFFVCVLTEHPARSAWGPKVVHLVLQSRGTLTRHVYKVVPADQLKPVAIGFVELTDAEFDAGQDIAGVWLYRLNGWRAKLVSDIPAAIRQAFNAMLTDRGISAGIVLSDPIPTAFDKLIQAIPGSPATLAEMVAKFTGRTGIDP